MRRSNYFQDNASLQRLFTDVTPLTALFEALGGDAVATESTLETWRAVLEAAGGYIGEEISQRARAVDSAGVMHEGDITLSEPMRANLEGLAALGSMGAGLPEAVGGSGLPFVVNAAIIEMLARACASTMVEFAFFTTPAALIHRFGAAAQQARYLPDLAAGRRIGAVAMTEPQAGSDVGAVRCRAERDGEGWRLHGRKQFISSGNGDFVLVLARMDDSSVGLEGLGVFIAERRSGGGDNYLVEKAEHKHVISGSPTCALVFEGTRAELLGERAGEGWTQILSFMNEARVGVAAQGLGICQAALVAAEDYAAIRQQMGRPIREHPLVADMLLDMRASTEALRALVYEAALEHDRARLLPPGTAPRAAERRLRELTPLVKWLGAEEAIRIARAAVQIHGGYGVMVENDVERHARDALVLSIYEGTSQIQALMALKDIIKAARRRPLRVILGRPLQGRDAGSDAARRWRDRAWAVLQDVLARELWAALTLRRGIRGLIAMLRGSRPDESGLRPLLVQAERICAALALLEAARAYAGTAGARPDLVERASRRAAIAAERLALLEDGDGGTLAQIARWERERLDR